MDLKLTADERSQLELIALHAGRKPSQVLLEAAQFLLKHDVKAWEWMDRRARPRSANQRFLRENEMEARLADILGR